MNGIPRMERVNRHPVLTVDGKPLILLAGEVHNSSSSSLEYMEQVWTQAKSLGMNCLLLPVTWELSEPAEGQFDFSLIRGLIGQARNHDMKIVFLWFGAWKNAQCYYAPEWVKTDTGRFRRAEIEKNKSFFRIRDFGNMPYTSLSYLCEETMRADARAFGRLMAYIREIDSSIHTVVSVQIENETGVMGAAREHSDQADRLFASQVPCDFADYMHENTADMTADMRKALQQGKRYGSWTEVFGPKAEEVFSAYHIAGYVNTVAEAGKKEYPIPFSVNCWLNKPGEQAGLYPSGGPVSGMREVWRFRAPHIDLYAPDIYVPDFYGVCREYTRRGEVLYIPECPTHCYAASRSIVSIGRFHALCYSPFGFEDMGKPLNAQQMALFGADASDPALGTAQEIEPYSKINRLLGGMINRLTAAYGTNRLQAGSRESETISVFRFEDIELHVNYLKPEGACLILREQDEFYILAYGAELNFVSVSAECPGLDLLVLEEGRFTDGDWHPGRRLNGDEAAVMTYQEPVLLRAKVFIYA